MSLQLGNFAEAKALGGKIALYAQKNGLIYLKM